MFEALIAEINAICSQINLFLIALKEATAAKNHGVILSRSSELLGSASLLTAKCLEINTDNASLDINSTLAFLECRKRAAFLLIECFAYVLASKRNGIGKSWQAIIVSIYDCANEGVHYLARDQVFIDYSGIIDDAVEFSFPVFRKTGMKDSTVFHTHTFMPWIQSISAPIRKAAKRYFRDELQNIARHPVVDVIFEAKPLGVQIGTKALVKFGDGYPMMTFYVKGHQNYTAMSSSQIPSSQRKSIDLKELFVYKILELTGVGPKVHFITHQSGIDRAFDKNALFIATQDVAYTKSSEQGKTKIFHPVRELYRMERGEKVGDERFLLDFNHELSHGDIAPIKLEATLMDIIARVFRLGDLNEDNFARVDITTLERTYEKWKLFDFKIPEKMEGRYVIGDEGSTVDGFLTGNGVLSHPNVFLQDALIGRSPVEKIRLGNEVINLLERGRPKMSRPEEHKMSLPEAIEQAFEVVRHYFEEPIAGIRRAELLGVNLPPSLADLHNYRLGALQNFEHLRAGLGRRM